MSCCLLLLSFVFVSCFNSSPLLCPISLEKQPERFAEITRRWASETVHDSQDFEIPFKELSAEEYTRAHKEMFKETVTVFSPESEQITIMSTMKSMASKAGKMLTDFVSV